MLTEYHLTEALCKLIDEEKNLSTCVKELESASIICTTRLPPHRNCTVAALIDYRKLLQVGKKKATD